ncbi:unnamed protein product [Adineta steineri]|uniref:Uncharacterized protein n=1 Tax=Adineta steineri TaxID=433720 RepID=A0A815N1T5_9BILA|nr:unnamed protein product [Adineta steineri]CAF3812082.1 unnamed protein product [Adineta steineri]
MEKFMAERLRIDMSLLPSQHTPKFIFNQFLRFFQINNAMPVFTELNQQFYQQLHQQLLNRITEKEQILHNRMKDPVTNPAILEKKP